MPRAQQPWNNFPEPSPLDAAQVMAAKALKILFQRNEAGEVFLDKEEERQRIDDLIECVRQLQPLPRVTPPIGPSEARVWEIATEVAKSTPPDKGHTHAGIVITLLVSILAVVGICVFGWNTGMRYADSIYKGLDQHAGELTAIREQIEQINIRTMKDADKDGVADEDDACHDVFGVAALKGCPDADKDGVADRNDVCPDVFGVTPLKGCPDADKDGVADGDDKCPQTFVDSTVTVDTKGCSNNQKWLKGPAVVTIENTLEGDTNCGFMMVNDTGDKYWAEVQEEDWTGRFWAIQNGPDLANVCPAAK
jgi:hypothetical protein